MRCEACLLITLPLLPLPVGGDDVVFIAQTLHGLRTINLDCKWFNGLISTGNFDDERNSFCYFFLFSFCYYWRCVNVAVLLSTPSEISVVYQPFADPFDLVARHRFWMQTNQQTFGLIECMCSKTVRQMCLSTITNDFNWNVVESRIRVPEQTCIFATKVNTIIRSSFLVQ